MYYLTISDIEPVESCNFYLHPIKQGYYSKIHKSAQLICSYQCILNNNQVNQHKYSILIHKENISLSTNRNRSEANIHNDQNHASNSNVRDNYKKSLFEHG